MGHRLEEYALGCLRRLVAAEADPRQRDQLANVLLGRNEVDRANAGLVFNQQVEQRLHRVLAALLRDLGERLALEWLQRLVLEAHEQQAVRRTGVAIKIRPVGPIADVVEYPLPAVRVAQSPAHGRL